MRQPVCGLKYYILGAQLPIPVSVEIIHASTPDLLCATNAVVHNKAKWLETIAPLLNPIQLLQLSSQGSNTS